MLMARQDDDRGQQPILLLVDDDKIFCEVMSRALEKRGFHVIVSHDVAQALSTIEASPPEYAVVDLWLPDRSGLALVAKLKTVDPHTNIVVLTGHASIATAVEAIKLGATYYLTKPVDADNVVHAFNRRDGDESVPLSDKPLSVERMEWEHINRVLAEHHGNISAAARALSMYRRTLQRKLRKRAREY
jgi:two-component system response regulator RegA